MGRKLILAGLAVLLGAVQANAASSSAREIVNLASGLRVDVIWASNALMQGVFLWPDNTSGSQEFYLLYPGTGNADSFNLRAVHSGRA